jgi:hypothetical protein
MKTLSIIGALVALVLAGCFRKSDEPVMFTGQVVQREQVKTLAGGWASTGKLTYAVVTREWVEWHYGQFRSQLSAGTYGIVRWDGRFSCTSFTTKFCADAQMRYFAQSFHSTIQAQSIGLGEWWYDPKADGVGLGHAVVAVLTAPDRLEFFEPQTGQWVKLTAQEQASAYLRKFD